MLELTFTTAQLLTIGVVASLLQVWGYFLYLGNKKIEPNPMTWLMFSYGTVVLTVLEWDKNATLAELLLPLTCSVLGLVVFYRIWKQEFKLTRRFWSGKLVPKDRFERITLISDASITIGYILSWVFAISGILSEEHRGIAVFLFLVLSNLSVLVEFAPIIKETYRNPQKESSEPWVVWTLAYSTLGVVTLSEHGFWSALMLYPFLNAVTHGVVAYLAWEKRPVK